MKVDANAKFFKQKKTLGALKTLGACADLPPLVRVALIVLRGGECLHRARSSGLDRYYRALGSGVLGRLLLVLELLPLFAEALRRPFCFGLFDDLRGFRDPGIYNHNFPFGWNRWHFVWCCTLKVRRDLVGNRRRLNESCVRTFRQHGWRFENRWLVNRRDRFGHCCVDQWLWRRFRSLRRGGGGVGGGAATSGSGSGRPSAALVAGRSDSGSGDKKRLTDPLSSSGAPMEHPQRLILNRCTKS